MNIAIIDADLVSRKKHRFPNLACMKLSAFYKGQGASVRLKTDYNNLSSYDKVYISKVFTDTECPISTDNIRNYSNVEIGGTGFYFDQAPNLPPEIEHSMPDYHLYDDWIEQQLAKVTDKGQKQTSLFDDKIPSCEDNARTQFKFYTDYSIGFLTRGCFRKCPFCVNQKYDHVFAHSPLNEFYDESRKKICLLDDNFFGFHSGYKSLIDGLRNTGRSFVFKQGVDIRILDDEKMALLFSSKYDGDFIFAFDSIKDYELIHKKLETMSKYRNNRTVKFYVLVGFESVDIKDIENAFERITLLLQYGCLPYIMRYRSKETVPFEASEYRSMYMALARWCNQPHIIKKMSFREFCEANQVRSNSNNLCSEFRTMLHFEKEHSQIAKKYFDIKFNERSNNYDKFI